MDGAYEDDQTRQLALDFGWIPVVPPKHTRLEPVEQDWAVVWTRGLLRARIFHQIGTVCGWCNAWLLV